MDRERGRTKGLTTQRHQADEDVLGELHFEVDC
jgi:hypothetical protein